MSASRVPLRQIMPQKSAFPTSPAPEMECDVQRCFICTRASPFLVWCKSLYFSVFDSAYPRPSGLFTRLSWTPSWLMTLHPGSALASSRLHCPKCFPSVISSAHSSVSGDSHLHCGNRYLATHPSQSLYGYFMGGFWWIWIWVHLCCPFLVFSYSWQLLVLNLSILPGGHMGESAYTACFVLDQVLSCV